jgi:hypothetical protein
MMTTMNHSGGEARAAETAVFEALCAAGLVTPCVPYTPRGDVPAELRDPSKLLARLNRPQAVGGLRPEAGGHAVPCTPPSSALGIFEDQTLWAGAFKMPTTSPERGLTLREVVIKAFGSVHDGWSVDRVLLDPAFNGPFIDACLALGTVASRFELNWALLGARKNGRLASSATSRRYGLPAARLEEFAFASEMVARRVQDRQWHDFQRAVSLDRIFCDPLLAEEFDALAAQLDPGYSPLEYRWAALALRKGHRSSDGLRKLRPGDFEDLGSTHGVRVGQLPKAGGVYCFSCEGVPVYAGHARSLRRQVELHFERAGVSVVPEWLADRSYAGMRLEIAPISGLTTAWGERLKAAHVAAAKPHLNFLAHPSLFAA